MQTDEIVFQVARPPSEVWARLVDLEHAPDWVHNMQSSSKQTDGPLGVGSVFLQVVEWNGSTSDVDLKVTEFEACRMFAHEAQSGPAAFTARFELEPVEGGTRVVHSFSISMGGMMRMMEPMLAGFVKKNVKESVLKLKQLVEAGA